LSSVFQNALYEPETSARPVREPTYAFSSDPVMLDISQMITTYGPWAIFTLVLIEDFGVPVPGETALITAAVLASQGKVPIEWLLPAAWLGAVLGDNIGYAIGRYAGRRVVLRFGGRVGITEARLSWVERFFARYGGAIVIVARFFVGLRQLNGIVAGISRMAAPTFMLCNAFGAALWVMVWGFGIYWFGGHFPLLLHSMGPTAAGALIVVGVILFGVLMWRRYRGARK
jgi:membrane protein DedA with SNARE-associated domain